MTMRNKLTVFLGLLLLSGSAWADPMNFWILNGSGSGGTYSLVHDNAGPSGGNHRNFNDGQSFWGDLTADGLTTSGFGDQWLSLDTGMDFVLHELTLFLDGAFGLTEVGGIAGQMVYTIYSGENVEFSGIFEFTADGYTTLFNQSTMTDGTFFAALWGGDEQNDLGIDFVFHGAQVPEPGTLILMGLGLLGMGFSRGFSGRQKNANS